MCNFCKTSSLMQSRLIFHDISLTYTSDVATTAGLSTQLQKPDTDCVSVLAKQTQMPSSFEVKTDSVIGRLIAITLPSQWALGRAWGGLLMQPDTICLAPTYQPELMTKYCERRGNRFVQKRQRCSWIKITHLSVCTSHSAWSGHLSLQVHG